MRSSLFLLCIFIYSFSHLSTLYLLELSSSSDPEKQYHYKSIFSFGDSLTDTGNLLVSSSSSSVFGNPPYGDTFFQHPTGRCSDGRLIVDFIAEAFGIPLLQPYLAGSSGLEFQQGANFAVAGATALDTKVLYEHYNITNLVTNSSLNVQLGWFKALKSSLCNTSKDCDEYLGESLFLVGEMGVNDYTYFLNRGGNMKKVRALVRLVIKAIVKTTSMLIEEGAVELVVPGNLPWGCTALYLTLFRSPYKRDYDPQNGCLKPYNAIATYHNDCLKIALKNLQRKYPQAKIFYADYYGASMRFFNSPQRYGFTNGALSACCGGGGPYNYNISASCGQVDSKGCTDPSTHANWDGIHLTEAAYRLIADSFLKGRYSSPRILHLSSSSLILNQMYTQH